MPHSESKNEENCFLIKTVRVEKTQCIFDEVKKANKIHSSTCINKKLVRGKCISKLDCWNYKYFQAILKLSNYRILQLIHFPFTSLIHAYSL